MTVVELGAVRVDDGATQAQSQAGVEVKMAPKTEELASLRKRKAALERKWSRLRDEQRKEGSEKQVHK